jgi:hypothetical protein
VAEREQTIRELDDRRRCGSYRSAEKEKLEVSWWTSGAGKHITFDKRTSTGKCLSTSHIIEAVIK